MGMLGQTIIKLDGKGGERAMARVIVRPSVVEVWISKTFDSYDVDRILRDLPADRLVVIYRSGYMPLEEATEDLMVAQRVESQQA